MSEKDGEFERCERESEARDDACCGANVMMSGSCSYDARIDCCCGCSDGSSVSRRIDIGRGVSSKRRRHASLHWRCGNLPLTALPSCSSSSMPSRA